MAGHQKLGSGILVSASAIWGLGFIFQAIGTETFASGAYVSIRFFCAGLFMLPVLWWLKQLTITAQQTIIVIIAGALLALAAWLQQWGLETTSVTNAAFITTFYIPLVQLLGWPWFGRPSWVHIISALICIFGIGMIGGIFQVNEGELVINLIQLNPGDLLVGASAFAWAAHVLWIGSFSEKVKPLAMSTYQFLACGIIMSIGFLQPDAINTETLDSTAVFALLGAVAVVVVGYSFQVWGQQYINPTVAALIFSLEAVFAYLFGFTLMGETLSIMANIGCLVVIAAVTIGPLSTLYKNWKENKSFAV